MATFCTILVLYADLGSQGFFVFNIGLVLIMVESIKTTSVETVGTGVLDKNKKHYLRSKDR